MRRDVPETKHPGGRPRKFQSVAEMDAAIEAYFVQDPPYTVTGLAMALGMTRQGLCDYQERDEFTDTIEKAKARVEESTERRMLSGEGWGPGHIFSLKNNYRWRDEHQIEETGTKTIVVKYAEATDGSDSHPA
jgi:hypothetical protein